MTVAAIIVAAGRGTRAGGGEPKQWRSLAGQSVLAHSVAAFAHLPRVVVVLHPDDMARGVAEFRGRVILVAGGGTRSESVLNALESLEFSGVGRVLFHDGARPFASAALIGRVAAALDHAPAAAPALPVTDALWTGAGGCVTGIADRAGLYRAQTPQGFRLGAILAAHRAHPGGSAAALQRTVRPENALYGGPARGAGSPARPEACAGRHGRGRQPAALPRGGQKGAGTAFGHAAYAFAHPGRAILPLPLRRCIKCISAIRPALIF